MSPELHPKSPKSVTGFVGDLHSPLKCSWGGAETSLTGAILVLHAGMQSIGTYTLLSKERETVGTFSHLVTLKMSPYLMYIEVEYHVWRYDLNDEGLGSPHHPSVCM